MRSSAKRLLSLVIVLAMALSMLPVFTFAAGATTTVYCQAPDSWSTCKVYWWGSNAGTVATEPDEGPAAPPPSGWSARTVTNPEWPGVDMIKGDDGIWYYDVPSDATGLIFNNGSGTQTGDLTVPTDENVMFVFANNYWTTYGKVEVVVDYYVAGSEALCGVNWSPNAAENKMADENKDGIYTLTYTGVAAGSYEFKVTSGSWAESWGNNGANYSLEVTEDNSTVTISFDPAAAQISVAINDTAVTEPSTEPVAPGFYVAGSMNSWKENDAGYMMAAQADGTYALTFAVTAGAYELKVTDGTWTNCWPGENYTFNAETDGDVTVTFNPLDCSVNVTGDCLGGEATEPSTEPVASAYYVAGTMNGWNNPDEAYLMNANGDGTYSLTFAITAGDHSLKVTDGTWTNSWGDNGNNYNFKAAVDGDITVAFDPADGSVSVTGDCLGEKDPLVINAVYAVGATGLTGFDWAIAENEMTNNGGVYTITFENVAPGTYDYKFAANGTWDLNWAAGVETVPGETYTAWKNAMGNSTVVVAEVTSSVTLTLDLTAMDPYTGEGATCSVEITAAGTPALPTTPAEIVDAAYALAGGESLEGTYTLTGEIVSIDTAYSSQYKNITVSIVVEGKEDKPIVCYRLKGEGADTLTVGDIITVTGTLMNYEKTNEETGETTNTIEFTTGCTLDAVEKPVVVAPTDPKEIVDAAYALETGVALPYEATLTGKIVEINVPFSSQYKNITVTIAVEGKEDKPIQCFCLAGEGADSLKLDDTITVTGILKNYNGTVQFNQGCTLDNVIPGGGEEIVVPEDPKEIVDAAYELAPGAVLPYEATLTGKITEITEAYSEEYNNITVNMVVTGREDKPILCYRMKGDGVDALAVGNIITVTGNLKNYTKTDSETGITTNTIEFTPCTLVEIVEDMPTLSATVSGELKTFGDAAAAATVELLVDGAVKYTLTTTEATYSFESVELGSYTLKVSKEDHVTREYAITVEADVKQDVKIHLIGDVTGDGRVNVADTSKVYSHVKGTAPLSDYAFACADVDSNGRINVADTSKVYGHVKGSKPLW